MRRILALGAALCAIATLAAQDRPQKKRNVIVFVADGLRYGSVNAIDTPAFWKVRTEGVNFTNSHAVYPTLTMPNAAAIATGHYPGDTGQFANHIFAGFPVFDTGNFGVPVGTMTPNVENVEILGDINDHFGGNYLREASLLAYARSYGYNTAALGKIGPSAMQDLTELSPQRKTFRLPTTIILDSETGLDTAVPMTGETVGMLKAAGLTPAPPRRNQPAATNTTPGVREANVAHYQWFADAITKAILPKFSAADEPFALVYWSGDPDQTQHAQGDSMNALVPGVNGPTSKAAVRSADNGLKQILDYVNSHPDLAGSTNIFVTADHGFSTASRREIDAAGTFTRSYAAGFTYKDQSGRQEVNTGFLPNGHLAIDLAHALNLPLYDPSIQITDASGLKVYASVDPTIPQQTAQKLQRPIVPDALIGGHGRIGKPTDAKVVVATNVIYVPDNDRQMVQRVVRILSTFDYVGGIFVNDRFGQMNGALPMSAVALIGGATTPKPAVVVSAKTFATDPRNPFMTGVIVSSERQHGQGDHGSLSRANSYINMAAIGPDFKKGFIDAAPASNADIKPTLASVLGFKIPNLGRLGGRVLSEALSGGRANVRSEKKVMRSRPSASGMSTVLMYQQVGSQRYFDEACFTAAPVCGQ